jgi:hypothetical protein
LVRRGGRLGESKPSPLSNLGGWTRIFAGDYQVRPSERLHSVERP